jgi:hypothetical protein
MWLMPDRHKAERGISLGLSDTAEAAAPKEGGINCALSGQMVLWNHT